MLFIAALSQDGGGAVVKDGGGLDGRQAAHGDGRPPGGCLHFGWTGMCFCQQQNNSERSFSRQLCLLCVSLEKSNMSPSVESLTQLWGAWEISWQRKKNK